MFNIIERYINKLTKEDIKNFATKKGATLSSAELDFTFDFVKKNWKDVLKNPNLFDLKRYQNHYSKENFEKIKQAFNEYYQKFGTYL